MREEILEVINTLIRSEKGSRVTEDSTFLDAALDSFGYAMFFMGLDTKYDYFNACNYGDDPFKEIPYSTLTVKEIIDKCLLGNTRT